MKSVPLGDLRELLQGAAFSTWWTEYGTAMVALEDARSRHDDLVSQSELMLFRSELAQRAAADVLSRVGEEEHEGARCAADAQKLENRALELVGEFEDQRLRTSDLWVRLGGAERAAEDRREEAARGARGNGAKARADLQTALRTAERQLEQLRARYEAGDRKRARLWEQVEAAWAASFERSLAAAEHGLAGRRVKRDAERLFEEAEERRARGKQLAADAKVARKERDEADRRRSALLGQAREQFGCAAGDAFLYWRNPDDERSAFAVALSNDPDGANIEVKALGIYAVGRQRGVAALEPARDGVAPGPDAGDRRFDEYLLGRRNGRRARKGGP